MGCSNNNWRKILTILMIINLCFILFAKFSKVFGAFSVTYNNYDIPITDSLIDNSPYYAIFATQQLYGDGYPYFWLVRSNSPMQARTYPSGSTRLVVYNTNKNGLDYYLAAGQGFIQDISKMNFTIPTYDGLYLNANGYDTNWNCVYTNYDIKNYDNPSDTLFPDNSFTAPYFDNLTEIENGYPNGVFISRGSYSEDDALYFHLLKITNTVPDGNQSTYYYDSKVFKLTKDSKYYKTYDADTDNNYSYYYIKRSALTLDTNSSYLYVLSNSGDSISNSYGILQPDNSLGIYDVVESDTAGVITEQQALNDKMTNINNTQQDIVNNQQDIANNSNNINNFLNENTVSNDTQTDVDNNLNFNNSSPQFAELQTNFFSRLSNIIGDFGNYSLDTIDTINIPIPHSNKSIPLKSDLMISHIPNDINFIITAFWCFIFGKYFLNYLLLIYKLITTGQLIDYYSSNDEIIVADVL